MLQTVCVVYEKQCRSSPNLSERMYNIRPQSRVGNPTNSSTMFCLIRIIISLWGSCIRIKNGFWIDLY